MNELLNKIVETVKANYIIAERVPNILSVLREKATTELRCSNGSMLAEELTTLLRKTSDDLHFKVNYNKHAQVIKNEPTQESPEEIAEFKRIAALNNYGCELVRRLRGNVGLWKISEFYDIVDGSRPTFIASMNFLSNTDALIVDLRDNTGGDPETVSLACSFFFGEEPVHLNTLVSKNGEKKWWTLPTLDCQRYMEKPVYVLTNEKTFSAAEEFAYNLKCLRRARVVGRKTAGAAHARETFRLDEHFSINVPIERPINPISGTNWEKTGVLPDVEVDPDNAFELAYWLCLLDISKIPDLQEDQRSEILSSRNYLINEHECLRKPEYASLIDLEEGSYDASNQVDRGRL